MNEKQVIDQRSLVIRNQAELIKQGLAIDQKYYTERLAIANKLSQVIQDIIVHDEILDGIRGS